MSWGLIASLEDREGVDGSNDNIRSYFFNSLFISHFSIRLLIYQMVTEHGSVPREIAVSKIDKIPALIELTF